MARVGVYDQIKSAFQDLIAPELQALRGEMRVLDQKIAGVHQRIDGLDQKVDTLGQRPDEKIDSLAQRLADKIDSLDARLTTPTFASAWPPSRPAAPAEALRRQPRRSAL
jgi:hypothetical protein